MSGNHFFALYPPPKVRARMAAARRKARDGQLVQADRLHLTLAFLGKRDDDELRRAQRAADTLEAPGFTLLLDRLGFFPRGGILWLGPAAPPPALMELSASLRDHLLKTLTMAEGQPDVVLSRAPAFIPHITLARRVPKAPAAQPRSVRWSVARFVLMRSSPKRGGHVYDVLDEWPLYHHAASEDVGE